MEGIIKTLTDKGYGFITVEGEEKDLFFHGKELIAPLQFSDLREGDRLSFEKADSEKGPNAIKVTRIS